MHFQNQKGVTLLEVLLSMVILTIILVSLMKFFPQMELMNKSNVEKTEAINLAKKELVEWQKKDFESFLANPSKDVMPEYDREIAPYYVFSKLKDSYTVEIWFNKIPDLNSNPTKAHIMLVKIINDNNAIISETYGYYLYE